MKLSGIISSLSLFYVLASQGVIASDDINMKEVKKLAKKPVDVILNQDLIETFSINNYWKSVHNRNKPLVVFFYSNKHGPSQRLATLIKYVSPHYSDKLSFARLKVNEEGIPVKNVADDLNQKFSLDSTPGILFYDNVKTDMVLEHEDYIDADFKEFRSPGMLLWKTYYNAVRKELDTLLAD